MVGLGDAVMLRRCVGRRRRRSRRGGRRLLRMGDGRERGQGDERKRP